MSIKKLVDYWFNAPRLSRANLASFAGEFNKIGIDGETAYKIIRIREDAMYSMDRNATRPAHEIVAQYWDKMNKLAIATSVKKYFSPLETILNDFGRWADKNPNWHHLSGQVHEGSYRKVPDDIPFSVYAYLVVTAINPNSFRPPNKDSSGEIGHAVLKAYGDMKNTLDALQWLTFLNESHNPVFVFEPEFIKQVQNLQLPDGAEKYLEVPFATVSYYFGHGTDICLDFNTPFEVYAHRTEYGADYSMIPTFLTPAGVFFRASNGGLEESQKLIEFIEKAQIVINLMRSEVIPVSVEGLTEVGRPPSKKSKKANKPIVLRPFEYKPRIKVETDLPSVSRGPISCRYSVRKHRRLQRCGPGLQFVREVWVDEHERGPENAPMNPKRYSVKP